jgi:hypothetical protein
MLGFAFSEAQADGWWTSGGAGATPNAFAVAGKILYDNLAWGQAIPAMGSGVLAAFDALDGWYQQAAGATGEPELSMGIAGGGTSISGSAFVEVSLQFPGTGHGVVGQELTLSISGATFNSPSGSTSVGLATGTGGSAVVPIFAAPGSTSVTIQVHARVGHTGMGFYHSGNTQAQYLATIASPVTLGQSAVLTNRPTVADGTLDIEKAVNDGAYYGPGNAVFGVVSAGALVATLTTDSAGVTPQSPPLTPGVYQVSELTAPPFYQRGFTQTVTVVAGTNTIVYFAGALENHITPSSVTIAKRDGHTGQPLDGAVFDVHYDSANNGTFDEDLGDCTTSGPTGTCSPRGNDGPALLPGYYEITEIQAPPGYGVSKTDATQTIFLTPGENGSAIFYDYQGGLEIVKAGNDTAYAPIVGAGFTVEGPLPSTSTVGTLTVRTSTGSTRELYPLVPGRYVVTETTIPVGYQAEAPITVNVTGGSPSPTVVDVLDPIQPASVTIAKVNAETGGPIAGAEFAVSYAPIPGGPFSESLGTCTTTVAGTCSPSGNDGTALLPGRYQITEVSPPPGYVLPTSPVKEVTLAPSQAGTVQFSDQPLVSVSFQKVATGDVNPAEVTFAGADIQVTTGTDTGAVVTGCTTNSSGRCTTPIVLDGGQSYCWSEVAAPAGLLAGAHGCFTASMGQSALPITVSDPGTFVAVAVKKVDASNPTVGLSGAVFDLYRVDGGAGPDEPTPPAGIAPIPGETWVARATTQTGGMASFPLQFPGYAYCVVERTPPPNYVATTGSHCTGVLTGSPSQPATVTYVTVSDVEATVTLQAFKYNSRTPYTGIPGATYDVYVEGSPPPSGVPSAPPVPAPAAVPGDTWYARGTTDASGDLDLTVPAGYAWCLREVSAPLDYVLDTSLHCTAVLQAGLPLSRTTVAIPETPAVLYITAQKYNVEQPDTDIPGATYELLAQGPLPPGGVSTAVNGVGRVEGESSSSSDAVVPNGDELWAVGTSNAAGQLNFAVPAGYSWCLHELHAPNGYEPDPGFHCTAVLTTATTPPSLTIALPELPTPSPLAVLAFTGGPGIGVVIGGLLLIAGGSALLYLSRRRRVHRRPDDSPEEPQPTPEDGGGDGGSGDAGGSQRGGNPRWSQATQALWRASQSLGAVLLTEGVLTLAIMPSPVAYGAPPRHATVPVQRPDTIAPGTIAEHDVSAYELTDVACSTARDCVAVGYAAHPSARTSSAVTLYSTTGAKRFVAATTAPAYTPVTRRGTDEAVTGSPTCGPKAGSGDSWNASGCYGLLRVTCPSATVCFAMGGGGHSAYLWRSTDGGKTWVDLSTHIPANGSLGAIMGMAITTAAVGSALLVGEDPQTPTPSSPFALRASGLATTAPQFTSVSLPPGVAGLAGVTCTTATHCLAAGSDTTGAALALASTDSGATWSVRLDAQLPSETPPLRALACATATRCVAVGGDGVQTAPEAAVTTDAGMTWHVVVLQDVARSEILYDVSCSTTCDAVGATSAVSTAGVMSRNGVLLRNLTAPSAGRTTLLVRPTPLTTPAYGITVTTGVVVGGAGNFHPYGFGDLTPHTPTAAITFESIGKGSVGSVTCGGSQCVAAFPNGDHMLSYDDSSGFNDSLVPTMSTVGSDTRCVVGTTICVAGDLETTTGSHWGPIVIGSHLTVGAPAVTTETYWIGCTASACYGITRLSATSGGVIMAWTPTGTLQWLGGSLPVGSFKGAACTSVGEATTCLYATTTGIFQSATATTTSSATAPAHWRPDPTPVWTKVSSLQVTITLTDFLLSCAPLGKACMAIGMTHGQRTTIATSLASPAASSWRAVSSPELATDLVTSLACTGTGQCGMVEATSMARNTTPLTGVFTTVVTTPDAGAHWDTHRLARPVTGLFPSLSCSPGRSSSAPACELAVSAAAPLSGSVPTVFGTSNQTSSPFETHTAEHRAAPIATPSVTHVSSAADPNVAMAHSTRAADGADIAHHTAVTYTQVFSDSLVPEYDATAVGTATGPYNLVVKNVTGSAQEISDMGVFDATNMPVNQTTGTNPDDPNAIGLAKSAWPLSADTEYVIAPGANLCSALPTHALAPQSTCNIPVIFTPDRPGSVTNYLCYDYTAGTSIGNCTYLLGTTVNEPQGTQAVPPGCARGASNCPPIDQQGVAVVPGQDAGSVSGGPVVPGVISATAPSHGLFAQTLFFTGRGRRVGTRLTQAMVIQNYEGLQSARFAVAYDQGNTASPQYSLANGQGDGCGPSGTPTYPYVLPAHGQCVIDVTWIVPSGPTVAAVATIESDTPAGPSSASAYGSIGLLSTKGTFNPTTLTGTDLSVATVIEGVSLSATPTTPTRVCTALTGTHRHTLTVTAAPGMVTLVPGAVGTPVATVECTGKPAGAGVAVTWTSAAPLTATVAPPTGLTDATSTDASQVAAVAVGTTTVYACVGNATYKHTTAVATHLCVPVAVDVVAAPHLACGAFTWSLAGTGQMAKVTTRFGAPLSVTLACTGRPLTAVPLTWAISLSPSGASGTFGVRRGPTAASTTTSAAGAATSPPVYANAIADTPGETWPVAVTATLTGVGVPIGAYALSNTSGTPPGSSCPASATAPGWVLSGAGAPERTTSGGPFTPVKESVECETTAGSTPQPTASVAFSEPVAPPNGAWNGVTGPVAPETTGTGTFAGHRTASVATSPASVASINLTATTQSFVVVSPTSAPLTMGGLPLGSLDYPMAIEPTASCRVLAIGVDPVTVALVVGTSSTLTATVTCTGHGAPAGLSVTWHAASDVVTLSPIAGVTSAAATVTTAATAATPGVTTASACVTATSTCSSAQITVTRPYTCAHLGISASPSHVFVGPGTSAPVEAAVECTGRPQTGILVDWSTTTTGVATVAPTTNATGSQGTTVATVTGVSLGTTPLTACVSGTTTCATVTVVVDQLCPAETVSVSPGAIELAVGARDLLVATVDCAGVPTPAEPIAWSASPQTPITLTPTAGDSGVGGKMPVTVTGAAPGQATAVACLQGASLSAASVADGQCAEAVVDVIAPQGSCVRSWSLAGTGQVTKVTTRFAVPLSVTITCTGKPESGVRVVWEVASTKGTQTPSGAFVETTTYATHRAATALTNATGTATSPPIIANSDANATGTHWTVGVGIGTMTTTPTSRSTKMTGLLGTYALTNTADTPPTSACPASGTAPGWVLSGADAPQTTGSGGPFAPVKETLSCDTTAGTTPEPTATVAFTQPTTSPKGTWDTTATRVATATTTADTFAGHQVTDVATSPGSVAPKNTIGATLVYVVTSPTTAPKTAGAPYVGALDYEFAVTPSLPGCPDSSITASSLQMTLELEGTGNVTASVTCTGTPAPPGTPVNWAPGTPPHVTVTPPSGGTTTGGTITVTVTGTTPGTTTLRACITGTEICTTVRVVVSGSCPAPSIAATPTSVRVTAGSTAPLSALVSCGSHPVGTDVGVTWHSAATATATVAPAKGTTTVAGTVPATVDGVAPGTTVVDACIGSTTTCAAVTVVVVAPSLVATTTTLVATPDPADFATPVHLVASVSAKGVPLTSGMVTFTGPSGALLCTGVPIAQGEATCTVATLPVGTDTIGATATPSIGDAPSSGKGTATVVPDPTTTSLTPTPASSLAGQSVTLVTTTQAIEGRLVAGTVTVATTPGVEVCGPQAVESPGLVATTTCAASSLPTGADPLVAAYSGSPDDHGSKGTALETVTPAPPATTPPAKTTGTKTPPSATPPKTVTGTTPAKTPPATTPPGTTTGSKTPPSTTGIKTPPKTVTGTTPAKTPPATTPPGKTTGTSVPVTWHCTGRRCSPHFPVPLPAKPVPVLAPCPQGDVCVVPTITVVTCTPGSEVVGHTVPISCTAVVRTVFDVAPPGGMASESAGAMTTGLTALPRDGVLRLSGWRPPDAVGSYAAGAHYHGTKVGAVVYLASTGSTVVAVTVAWCVVPKSSTGIGWWLATSLPWWLFLVVVAFFIWLALTRKRRLAEDAHDRMHQRAVDELDDAIGGGGGI